MIYLLRWSFKVEDIVGCTHLLVEVEYAQLEVELNKPVMVRLWKTYLKLLKLKGLTWELCQTKRT